MVAGHKNFFKIFLEQPSEDPAIKYISNLLNYKKKLILQNCFKKDVEFALLLC